VLQTELEPLLNALVRKEVLSLQLDPRSPERGQYAFLQDLLRHVAYETLAKRERKSRHLAAAVHLEQVFEAAELEIVEVVAAHYLAAYEAAPEDADADEMKARAREALIRAGDRAASLAATEEAQRYFEQAAELADSAHAEAPLRERAGEMAALGGRSDEAQVHYERALELFETEGETHPAARLSARLGEVEQIRGEIEPAIERMERAFAVLSADEPDADYVALAAQLGRLHSFHGDFDRASELLEIALTLSEALVFPEILVQALNSYGVISTFHERPETAMALFTHSLKLALEYDLPTPALRAYNNLADSLYRRDRYEEALAYHASGIALARKVGNRPWEWNLLLESAYPLMCTGRWDEALAAVAEIPESRLREVPTPSHVPVEIFVRRGQIDEARRYLALMSYVESSADIQHRAMNANIAALVSQAEGENERALAAAEQLVDLMGVLGTRHESVKLGLVQALEAAFALGRFERVEELLEKIETLRPGELSPFLRAQAARFRGRLGSEGGFNTAAATFREYGIVFWLAVTLLEHGEWLTGQGRAEEAEPLLGEAREFFERLGARPWPERPERVGGARAEVPV
jgi:tetratricopeptide (TPR) repeat protein